MDWLSEMLSWPFEWSSLHGIAEIRTPILKIAATTDAAAHKHTVQCKGDSYPEEGAAGVVFPYRKPKRLRVTESAGYRRGLKNPINKVCEAGFDISGNSFDLKVGFSCNNDCIHCVVSDKKFAGDMSTPEIISILESIHDQYGQVTFTGGEPTIRKDFIKLLKKARSSGLRINLQTNGRQFKDRDFAANSTAFLDNILIALHSHDEKQHDLITGKKGSWQETVQGIKNLVSTGRAGIVSSQTVISKSNCDNLVEICRFIDHLGIRHIHITFPHPNGSALVNFDRVVPRYSHIKKILHECFAEFGSRLIIEAVPLCYIHPYVGKVRTVDDEFSREHKRGGVDKSNSGAADSYFNDKGITGNYNEAIISEHRKSHDCTSCIYDKRCLGVWKEYYEAYRENLDLFPVKLKTKGTRLN
jgi:MoaA/NifB/PqqE/SkfB family radical SAM enzyme